MSESTTKLEQGTDSNVSNESKGAKWGKGPLVLPGTKEEPSPIDKMKKLLGDLKS